MKNKMDNAIKKEKHTFGKTIKMYIPRKSDKKYHYFVEHKVCIHCGEMLINENNKKSVNCSNETRKQTQKLSKQNSRDT